MSPNEPEPVERIPEDRVGSILARAAEIDRATRETVSIDALRTAAIEAGISASALDSALEEYAAGTVATTEAAPREERESWRSRLGRMGASLRAGARKLAGPAKLVGFFFLLGLTGAAGEVAFALGWAAWLAMTGYLVWKHRPARKIGRFAVPMLFMTAGLAFGFGAAEVDGDVIAALLGFGAPLLVAGALAVKVRLPRRSRNGDVEASTA